MNMRLPNTAREWQDPIVHELHEVRERLVEQYQGNLHSYSEAARAKAIALGFQLVRVMNQPTTPAAT